VTVRFGRPSSGLARTQVSEQPRRQQRNRQSDPNSTNVGRCKSE
jgi:hypothetical protein